MTDDPDSDPFAPEKQIPLIEDAIARGQAALARGVQAEAVKWLDRAHRLAPGDSTITLSLASAFLGADNDQAASLFSRVLATADVRDAWCGLATARFLMKDLPGARAALHEALSRHVPHPGVAGLVGEVTRLSGARGWCGLTSAGVLDIQVRTGEAIEILMDGQKIAARRSPTAPARTEIELPLGWSKARSIIVTAAGENLIGSPISAATIAAATGWAAASETGVRITAWHPADADHDPVLRIIAGSRRTDVTLTAPEASVLGLPPLTRPRSLLVPWSDLPPDAPVHIRDRHGVDLLGSPLMRPRPAAFKAKRRPPRVIPEPRAVTIIVRSPRAPDMWLDTETFETRVIDWDGAPLPASLTAIRGRDVVVLDGHAIPSPGFLSRLRESAYAAPDIGVVTPLSNEGPAAYPLPEGSDLARMSQDHGLPQEEIVAWLDRLARQGNQARILDQPKGGGPCIFIRADCLAAASGLPIGARGGDQPAWEEFRQRITQAGWRHVVLTGLFTGLSSTGEAVPVLDRGKTSAALFPARRRLDLARWRLRPRAKAETVIFITHDDGGGVAARVNAAVRALEDEGGSAIVLRPVRMEDGTPGVAVADEGGVTFPNLRFALPREEAALARLLREARPAAVELHHFLIHDPSIFRIVAALDVPFDVHIHDFIWFCPRIALVGRGRRYCGEPDQTGCRACVAETGHYLHEDIDPGALAARSLLVLTGARRVVVPSRDTARRMSRHFPGIKLTRVPHEDDLALPALPPPRVETGTIRVCVAGGIGLHKGFDVLLGCARDARERGLDLTFTVAGQTTGDAALIETGHVFITGRYAPEEAVSLIQAQDASMGFFPSIWPETWSLGLTELWRAGLRVVAFDIGAPAERIRRTGLGFLLPLGMAPAAINNALLNAGRGRSFLPIRRASAYKPPTGATLSK